MDILTEDIFRGRRQTKYIKLAAKAARLAECVNYNKFSLITGIQKDKLVNYMKESCGGEKELIGAAKLYLKLDENRNNDMEEEIAYIRERLTEEKQLAMDIDIVENGMHPKTIIDESVSRLKDFLEEDKIKFFLPKQVLEKMLCSIDEGCSINLRGKLFLQCLYSGFRYSILMKVERHLKIQSNIGLMSEILCPWGIRHRRSGKLVGLTESIELEVYDTEIDEADLTESQAELQRMGLDYLAEFCGFLLNPTLSTYQDLCRRSREEEDFLSEKYQRLLKSYIKQEPACEEEFEAMMLERKRDHKSFVQGDFEKIYSKNLNVVFGSFYYFHKNILRELMDLEKIPFANLRNMNDDFFDMYMYAASGEVRAKDCVMDTDERTVEGMIMLLAESVRRNNYYYQENLLIASLAGSMFKKNLWEQVPDFPLAVDMLEKEYLRSNKGTRIRIDILEKAIGSIVSRLVCDGKENSYLSVIPILIDEPIDIRKCISEHAVRELEQLEYSVGANLLTMKLLKMCMDENSMPGEFLDDLLKCDVPREYIYWELEKMLRYCGVKNKEKLWVEMYLRLKEEEFRGDWLIRKGILDDMIEAKSNMG